MKGSEDCFVRKSYFGGATDYYKGYGQNLLARSLRERSERSERSDILMLILFILFAMKKPMPLNLIKVHKNISLSERARNCFYRSKRARY